MEVTKRGRNANRGRVNRKGGWNKQRFGNRRKVTDTVEVCIPKELETKSHEAVQRILSECKEDVYISCVKLGFQDHKTIGKTVKKFRRLKIGGSPGLLVSQCDVSNAYHQIEKEPTQVKEIRRTFVVPNDKIIDMQLVKEHFNAESFELVKRKPYQFKVFRVVFKSEELAIAATEKPMSIDDVEIVLKDPAMFNAQGMGQEQKKKFIETNIQRKKNIKLKEKERIKKKKEETDNRAVGAEMKVDE